MDSNEIKNEHLSNKSYLKPGLRLREANTICMEQCRGQCCRGALILRLGKNEVAEFKKMGAYLGIETNISVSRYGDAWVKFSEHIGDHCPMLDPDTSQCLIYDNRPARCRTFPEKPTPGCPISID
jgi:Fe-S-cluster containining protein